MKQRLWPVLLGVLLVIVGVLSLLGTIGLFDSMVTLIWAALFACGSAFLWYTFLGDRDQWWALIPGSIVAAIALVILLDVVAPGLDGMIDGTLVVGAISASFLLVYANRRSYWWALIPGGIMAGVALMTLLEAANAPVDGGAIVVLGIGLTFVGLSFVRDGEGRRLRWALIPGGIMLLIGVFLVAESAQAAALVLPAVMVLAGLFFLLRGVVFGKREE